MTQSISCLKPLDVKSFLDGELTPEKLIIAEEHLEQCENCRSAIERAIGPEEWWGDVRQSLSSQDSDLFSTNELSQHIHEQQMPMTNLLELLGPTDDPAMLGRIGTYEICGLLGQGGMGAVFKGFDRSLNRFVAIKMLLPHLAMSGAARKRFAREGQAVAAVVDDHVMAIHCVDEWQGIPYLVMTYSRGVSLQNRISGEGPLELREILRIGMQAAKGLTAAHSQGIVHRDVKPANIFLDENVERVQLMDFGLARAVDDASLTRTGILAGTPQYMSPEQARAEKVDQRSDLFSLGAVLYAMCTGRAPFRAESSHSILRLITDTEPRPIREINPDIPEWLCQLISKLMSKRVDDRYQSAKVVAELMEACLAHVQQPTEIPLPSSLVPKLNRKSIFALPRRIFGVIAMVGALISALIATALSMNLEPPDIAGQWTSEDWGDVELVQKQPGQYEGTFTVTITNEDSRRDVDWTHVGRMHLKWTKSERRFNGTWQVGNGVKGKLSLRLVDEEIRGALTTSGGQQPLIGTPKLGDFAWRRTKPQIVPEKGESSAIRSPSVALVMLMHPELVSGNDIQQAAASVALGQLSSKDFCGILKFAKDSPQTPSWLWGGNLGVVKIGERRAELLKSIADSDTGDFPKFDPALRMAHKCLTQVDAVRRHMIVLTNGDPDLTNNKILQEFREAGITISVVHLELHGPKYAKTPKQIAEITGGKYYHVLNAQPSVIESIFRKEAAELIAGPYDQITSRVRLKSQQPVILYEPKRQNEPFDGETTDRQHKRETGGRETIIYSIGHLPLWTRDGKLLNPDLLIKRIMILLGSSWAEGKTNVQYDAGQRSLIVSTSKREHAMIARLIDVELPEYVPSEILVPAENAHTKAYSIADLPIWTSDGKNQNVLWLIKFLEQETDPLLWSVGTIHASYFKDKQQLIVIATEDLHQKIEGLLASFRSGLIANNLDQSVKRGLDHTTALGGGGFPTKETLVMRRYNISNLPLWTQDGKAQKVQLLLRFLKAINVESWTSGKTKAIYHSGPQSLTVITTERNHELIANIVAGSFPPFVLSGKVREPEGSKFTVSYPIADLPLWSKNGKIEGIPLLIRYLEWEIGTTLSYDQSVSSSYFNKEGLKIIATSDDHQKIVGALSTLRFELAASSLTNPLLLRFTGPIPFLQSLVLTPSTPLQKVVDIFNEENMLSSTISKHLPLLTPDEVVKSVRLALAKGVILPNAELQELRNIAESRLVHDGWYLQVATQAVEVDGKRFIKWSIRLLLQRKDQNKPLYSRVIRELLIPQFDGKTSSSQSSGKDVLQPPTKSKK